MTEVTVHFPDQKIANSMPFHTEIGEFIWRVADHLRGDLWD